MARLTLLAFCGAALLARQALNFVGGAGGTGAGRVSRVPRRAEAEEAREGASNLDKSQ